MADNIHLRNKLNTEERRYILRITVISISNNNIITLMMVVMITTMMTMTTMILPGMKSPGPTEMMEMMLRTSP